MRHDWIFDVLADLHDYASRNNLPELAQQVAEALMAARREIASDATTEAHAAPLPARGRAH